MSTAKETLEFKVSNFNVLVAFLGGFVTLLGLVSFLVRERWYLSEPLIGLLTGVTFSPHAANLIRPLAYAQGSQLNLDSITLYFSRLVLGIQLVLVGTHLPSKFLKLEWKALSVLLGPIMCAMWISTGLLIWAMVPNITILQALAIGACVTPTDPVLSNNIIKGKFADEHMPRKLQNIVIGESGANDGLGYPFLFLSLYLIKYTHYEGIGGPVGFTGGAGKAMAYWFGITWAYTIIMSALYGALVGWLSKVMLQWAAKRGYVDRDSFPTFSITLGLFIVGTLGMLGSDDILACFIAGNVFSWDNWFRSETIDDSFQPTMDILLNVSIFLWYGAVCPWYEFDHNAVIPLYRLIILGILVLLFRRLPGILFIHKGMDHFHDWTHALFIGFFGPIGVSAIFYLYTSLEFLRTIQIDGQERKDAQKIAEVMHVVVWFLVTCSIIVHGLSVPLGKISVRLAQLSAKKLGNKHDLLRGRKSQSQSCQLAESRSRSAAKNSSNTSKRPQQLELPTVQPKPSPLQDHGINSGKISTGASDREKSRSSTSLKSASGVVAGRSGSVDIETSSPNSSGALSGQMSGNSPDQTVHSSIVPNIVSENHHKDHIGEIA